MPHQTADIDYPSVPRLPSVTREPAFTCDLCGSTDTAWMKCKLVCRGCRAILMTCGDL